MACVWRRALQRALAVSTVIGAHFPTCDFWYLHIAGCDSTAQGKGFGATAVRSGLDRIAGSGLRAYLETANERNLAFYERCGFAVTGDWHVANDGPRFWSLSRG